MKAIVKFLFLVACLMVACNDSSVLNDGLAGVELKSAPGDEVTVFTVNPTGSDDTDNLKAAFENAKAAGSGSIVQLTEGEYFLKFIEIREFAGSFVGAGKGKTVVTALTGLDANNLLADKLLFFLIKFVGGDVYVGDMTLRTLPGPIVVYGTTNTGLNGLLLFADYTNKYSSAGRYIKATVNNVEFIGDRLPDGKYNCGNALRAAYDSRVTTAGTLLRSHLDISITNCSFETCNVGTEISYINGGKLVLGTKNNGNTFNNVGWSGFYDDINCEISVTENTFNISKGCYGLDIDNKTNTRFVYEPQTKSTVCNLEWNTFNHNALYYALWLHDHREIDYPDEDMPMLCQLKNNQFNMTEGANACIFTIELMNAVIRNNMFTGVVNYGLRISHGSVNYGLSENGLILGNNFSNVRFGKASIAFGPQAKNWTVVGGGQMNESIIDLGTGNTITGMNVQSSEEPFGQDISDNLETMRDAIKSW